MVPFTGTTEQTLRYADNQRHMDDDLFQLQSDEDLARSIGEMELWAAMEALPSHAADLAVSRISNWDKGVETPLLASQTPNSHKSPLE